MSAQARSVPVLCGFLTFALGPLAAQTTAPNDLRPHAHIAELVELADTARVADIESKSSTRLNLRNGFWDHGEGFAGPVDTGGYFGFDDGSNMVDTNIVAQLIGPQFELGWETVNPDNKGEVRHYVGNLVGSGPLPAVIDDMAAFEIYGPAMVNASLPSVLVINLHSTMPGIWSMIYPGDKDNNGIFPAGPNQAEVARLSNGTRNVFSAYIVPPQGHNPMGFYIQRAHQLVKAVELLLPSAYPAAPQGWNPDPITTVITGGSAGGFLATMMGVLYPNRFQGSMADNSSASFRRGWGAYDSIEFVFNQLGWVSTTPGFDIVRELQWNMGVHLAGTTLLLGSFPERWHAGLAAMNPQIERPHYFIFSDEDNIATAGTEWLNLIRAPGLTDPFGETLIPSQTQNGAGISWGVRENNCHTAERKGFKLADSTEVQGLSGVLAALSDLLDEVVANVGGIMPVGSPPVPTPPTTVDEPDNTTMTPPPGWVINPFDAVLARPLDRPNTVPMHTTEPSDQTIIDLAPGFPKNGQGLALRAMEIAGGFIFVGSGDGIVTKFQVNEGISYMPIEPVATSVELGQNISDLALTPDGNHLVVSTYRALYLLNTSDLTVFKQTDAAYNADWKHTDPRSLLLSELTSSHQGLEIVYATRRGGLFVRSFDLSTEILNFPEPGIVDIVIPDPGLPLLSVPPPFPAPAVEVLLNKPIYIMSSRGHIAAVELGRTDSEEDPVFARLRAVSAVQASAAVGLSMENWTPAGGGLTAFYQADNSFRFFDLDLLNPSNPSISNVGIPDPEVFDLSARGGRDWAICQAFGVTYAVVILEGWIWLVAEDGTIVSQKSLRSFGPSIDPLCVRVGEVVTSNYGQEIVISTLAGHVVWFGILQLLAAGDDLTINRDEFSPFPQTNVSVAGGWAMDPVPLDGQLHFADQTGAHWAMDPDGTLHFRSQIAFLGGANAVSPIMDMAHAGTTSGLASQAWTPPQPDPQNIHLFELNSLLVAPDLVGNPPVPGNPSWSHVLAATRTRIEVPSIKDKEKWADLPAFLGLDENFWVFTHGGDVTRSGSPRITMQWAGEHGWPNHVSRVNYNIAAGQGTVINDVTGVTGVWGSGGQMGVPSTVIPDSDPIAFTDTMPPGDFKDLRSDTPNAHPWQSLRLGDLKGNGKTYAAIATLGGRLMILDATTNAAVFEYDSRAADRDYGYGGLALAVGDLDGDPADEIIFGTVFRHSDSNGTRNFDASLIVFDFNGAEFVKVQEIHLGELGLDPTLMPGFGIAGIAIADIDPPQPGVLDRHPGNEVIVTTLNGELYVFETNDGSPIVNTPIHASVHAGSLGACNSISVADLNGDGAMEIYLASSQGTYRFDVSLATGQ